MIIRRRVCYVSQKRNTITPQPSRTGAGLFWVRISIYSFCVCPTESIKSEKTKKESLSLISARVSRRRRSPRARRSTIANLVLISLGKNIAHLHPDRTSHHLNQFKEFLEELRPRDISLRRKKENGSEQAPATCKWKDERTPRRAQANKKADLASSSRSILTKNAATQSRAATITHRRRFGLGNYVWPGKLL